MFHRSRVTEVLVLSVTVHYFLAPYASTSYPSIVVFAGQLAGLVKGQVYYLGNYILLGSGMGVFFTFGLEML